MPAPSLLDAILSRIPLVFLGAWPVQSIVICFFCLHAHLLSLRWDLELAQAQASYIRSTGCEARMGTIYSSTMLVPARVPVLHGEVDIGGAAVEFRV